MNDYITENHPAMSEFDIEGQEAAGTIEPAPAGGVDMTERQEVDVAPREHKEPITPETTTETTTETPPETTGETPPEATVEATETNQEQAAREAQEPPADAKPDDITDIVGPDGKYLTYREAAKATRNLQSMYDKKFSDQQAAFNQQQQQLEQWNQYYAQEQARQEQANENASITPEQFAHSIDVAPGDTLRWAQEHYPEAVPDIISRVRATKGDQLADQMLVNHQQSQMQQQQYEQQLHLLPLVVELAMQLLDLGL